MMSLFSGSGGFELSATLCGIEPVYASEVEPYPIAVTTSRFPNMKHLGDVSKINGAEIEPVDVITFGSPCQDMSIAGKRAGIKHDANGDDETTRSGLFIEAIRIIKEMRSATNGLYPTFAIWENVPGAYSSNKGADFQLVLQEFVQISAPNAKVPPPDRGGWPYADVLMGDGWSVAYRTFDAQYWGVPQRRRRIYLVADFRGERAGEILFKRQGLRWHNPQSGEAGEGTSADAERSTRADDSDGAVCYDARGNGDGVTVPTMTGDHENRVTDYTSVLVQTACAPCYALKMRSGCAGGGKGPLVQTERSATLATNNDQYIFQAVPPPAREMPILNDQGGSNITVESGAVSPTLRAETHGHPPCIMQAAGFKGNAGADSGLGRADSQAPTLLAGATLDVCISYAEGCWDIGDRRRVADFSPVCPTMTKKMGTGGNNVPCVICLQGNCIDRADTAGCNGKGWREDVSYTLNTIDRPAVAFGISSFASNAMQSSNPHSGFYEAKISRTLDLNGGNPACNQGGIAIVQSSTDEKWGGGNLP